MGDLVLAALCKEHSSSLVRFLTRRLKSREEAEDIAQAAMLRIHNLAPSKSLENPKAYLFQIANNLAIDSIRRKELLKRYIDLEYKQQSDSTDQDCGISPERIVAAQQQLRLIDSAIAQLPPNCRHAFLLHRRHGLSYSEIAKSMDVSVSSVEKYILQALRQCRKSLAQT
ncbi:sigma-70 family RNA polymerase sigma factor [Aurantivibrio infirmus]